MVVSCIWYLRGELKTLQLDSPILRYLKENPFAAAVLNSNYRTLRRTTNLEQTQAQKYLKQRLEAFKETGSSEPVKNNSSDDNNKEDHHYLSRYDDNS